MNGNFYGFSFKSMYSRRETWFLGEFILLEQGYQSRIKIDRSLFLESLLKPYLGFMPSSLKEMAVRRTPAHGALYSKKICVTRTHVKGRRLVLNHVNRAVSGRLHLAAKLTMSVIEPSEQQMGIILLWGTRIHLETVNGIFGL